MHVRIGMCPHTRYITYSLGLIFLAFLTPRYWNTNGYYSISNLYSNWTHTPTRQDLWNALVPTRITPCMLPCSFCCTAPRYGVHSMDSYILGRQGYTNPSWPQPEDNAELKYFGWLSNSTPLKPGRYRGFLDGWLACLAGYHVIFRNYYVQGNEASLRIGLSSRLPYP